MSDKEKYRYDYGENGNFTLLQETFNQKKRETSEYYKAGDIETDTQTGEEAMAGEENAEFNPELEAAASVPQPGQAAPGQNMPAPGGTGM